MKKLFKEEMLRIKNPFLGQSERMVKNARISNSKARPDGYIYILKLKGFDIYKIGVSSSPKRRIKDIDSSSPFGVECICLEWFKNAYDLEELLHDNFIKNTLRKEWFKINTKDIFDLIIDLKHMSKEGIYIIRK
jgi:hypothetical protein